MTTSKYNFPSPIRSNTFSMNDFLGVDFATTESGVENRRSPDSINVISGKTGSMDKRLGYAIEHIFTGKIWAIKNIKTQVYDLTETGFLHEIDVIVVHAGTQLWAYNPYLDAWQQADVWDNGGYYTTYALQERETNFIEYSNQNSLTLIHNNWINDDDDLLVLYCFGNSMVDHEGEIYCTIVVNDAYWQNVYYPVTSIGRSPNGLVSTPYDSVNLLVNVRINKFLSNATDKTFVLDYDGNIYRYNPYVLYVQQMKEDGTWGDPFDSSGNAITVTFNTASHSITFSAVPHATYKTGEDNIKVRFLTGQSTIKITNLMNNYLSYATYGLKGSNDMIFFCNNSSTRSRNKEIWCKLVKDETGLYSNQMYFDANNNSILGANRKTGYSKVGEYLILHGEREGRSSVAYVKQAILDDNGELVITNTPTTSQLGATAYRSFANLRDDPLFLSEAGITSVMIDNFTNTQTMQDRGFYINKRLLSEPNLDKAIAFVYDSKYYICVNSNVYIADPRKKSTEKLSYSESFQYDWYFWEGIDIQSFEIFGNELYFGTSDGRLCRFKNELDTHAYEDEVITEETTWANATVYNREQIVSDGGTSPKYYICIKGHTSDSVVRNLTHEKYWNEVTKGSDRFYVPVIAYWTTPILNLGDITVRKTLKNLWVRLEKYTHTGVRIYYSTQGLVKERFDGVFDFSDLDFSRFTFSTDTDPMVVVTNRQERKFMSIQFKIESRDNTPMSLLEIVGKYTTNNQYKG
jgi:hypothetical protein